MSKLNNAHINALADVMEFDDAMERTMMRDGSFVGSAKHKLASKHKEVLIKRHKTNAARFGYDDLIMLSDLATKRIDERRRERKESLEARKALQRERMREREEMFGEASI